MGGGPAGALFAYFLLDMARRAGLDLQVDVYEPRDFSLAGPLGCNMDGGVISESLVQHLAAEGLDLPPAVVQRGIDSYTLHMDVGSVRMEAAWHEKRIGALFRGAGPLGNTDRYWVGLDGYLLAQAVNQGARLIPARIEGVQRAQGLMQVTARGHAPQAYDLLAVAAGVNTPALRLFPPLEPAYRPPAVVKTLIREYRLGAETIARHLGNSFHVFLLALPGLDFAAIIPKGNYVTVCFLGHDLSPQIFESFLSSPVVKACMPPGWQPEEFACHCSPRMNIGGALRPFADRLVFIGDSGVSRLYKDGLGAAYRAAKAAAATAVLEGVGAEDFRRHYWPACREISLDNAIGKAIFFAARQIQHRRFARSALLGMVSREQERQAARRPMSAVLWDTFTGSAPYADIFRRALHPVLWTGFAGHLARSAAAALPRKARSAGQSAAR